jgi:hypothetical protein
MPTNPPTKAQVGAIQNYLEQEFPDCVRRMRWDQSRRVKVFEVSHGKVLHQVVVTSAFLEACPDYGAGLFDSELADYMREARSHVRRFFVMWQEGRVRIRSQLL